MRKLSTDEISKSYNGRQVVHGVSVQVTEGEVVGLLGPNGAGKTTSFYMIVGLIQPDGGRILLDDEAITNVPMYIRARQYGISYLPQEPSVFRKLTVEENILSVLEVQPIAPEMRRARAEKLIEQLNLGHIRKTRGYALSGGERRRVEIARVLITDHNVRETLSVTDRAYIINEGRIFRHGTPEQLGSDPEVRRVYLGESFSLG
jgi:lipopolysaccharide export system ATP-binding protein